jgi:hypothetical protein
MFTPPIDATNPIPNTFPEVSKKAWDHLRSFFLECTKPKILHPKWLPLELQGIDWRNICKKKRKKYKNFPDDMGEDVLQFLEKLLRWLEEKKVARKPPFKCSPRKTKLVLADKDFSALLDNVKRNFLDGFCMPFQPVQQGGLDKNAGKSSAKQNPEDEIEDELNKAVNKIIYDDWMVKKFLTYVAAKLLGEFWGFELMRVGPNDGPVVPDNFISWLMVVDGDIEHRSLYIFYNDLAVNTGPRYRQIIKSSIYRKYNYVTPDNKYKVVTRREKLILHEMGHAVNHLEWYRKTADGFVIDCNNVQLPDGRSGKWMGVPTHHELDAWAYIFAVRSCVKSARSWITRLVDEADNEWFNP